MMTLADRDLLSTVAKIKSAVAEPTIAVNSEAAKSLVAFLIVIVTSEAVEIGTSALVVPEPAGPATPVTCGSASSYNVKPADRAATSLNTLCTTITVTAPSKDTASSGSASTGVTTSTYQGCTLYGSSIGSLRDTSSTIRSTLEPSENTTWTPISDAESVLGKLSTAIRDVVATRIDERRGETEVICADFLSRY